MTYLSTRMASLALAFGIFFAISCSSTEPIVTSQPQSTPELSYEQQLREIDNKIAESPENEELRIEKARLLTSYAASYSSPEQRISLYRNLKDLSQRNNPEIDSIIKSAWNKEHSTGVRLLQEQSDTNLQNSNAIVAHFDNAITLIPDSLQSYTLKATTLYRIGNLHDAIETLEIAKENTDANPAKIDEKIAYLNLESGNLQEAVVMYHQLSEAYPDNDHYRNGLINAMIINEQHEDTIAMLRELSESYPARFFYQESLATETYFLVKKESELLLQTDPDQTNLSQQLNRIISYLDESHELFTSLSSQAPVNEESTLRIAAFYKNSAQLLGTLADELPIEESEQEMLEERFIAFLEHSLPSWERLTEMNPDNMDYLLNLQEVYRFLGMDEEADAIERSINF
ncbi:MAG: hypothetical protein JJU37_10635 [Balneolaceae bacterium]|nr:hypothetical protein [Balneolaceae bacterium]